MKRLLTTLIRILISFGLLGLLVYLFRYRLGECVITIRQANPYFLLLTVFTYVLFIWISAWRWQVLLAAQGLKFSTPYLTRVFTIGLFFCKILPTSIGGDVMRIAYTSRPGKTAEAFSATLLDRLLGFQSLTFLAVITAFFVLFTSGGTVKIAAGKWSGPGVVFLLLAVLLFLFLFTAVLFNDTCHRFANRLLQRGPRWIAEMVDRSYQAVKAFRHQPRALAKSFLSGIGVQAALSLAWFFAARSIQATVPVGYYFIFIPILNIVVNIPTIGGLGVREAAFVLFFTPGYLPGHLSAQQALAVAIIFLAIDLVFAILGGILFAFTSRPGKNHNSNKEDFDAVTFTKSEH